MSSQWAPNSSLKEITRLVEDVFATREGEIQCDQASVQIGLCADQHLAETEARERYPALFQHFRFCPDCETEYFILTDLINKQINQQLERPPWLSSLPDEFRPPQPSWGQRLFRVTFPGFITLSPQLAMRGELTHKSAEIRFGDEKFWLTLQVESSSTIAGLYTLLATLKDFPTHTITRFAQAIGQLEVTTDGEIDQEQTFNAAGEAIFQEVSSGNYNLRIQLGEQLLLIEQILIL